MRVLTFLVLSAILFEAAAGGIDSIRVRAEQTRARVVFDLKDAINYRAFTMRNPDRVVIDIENIAYPKALSLPSAPQSAEEAFEVLDGLRYATRNDSGLRIVLDLNARVALQHTILPPRQHYGHRLVLDLYRPDAQVTNETRKPLLVKAAPRAPETKASSTSMSAKPPMAESKPASDDGAKALALLNGGAAAEIQTQTVVEQNGRKESMPRATVAAESTPTTAHIEPAKGDISPSLSKPPRNVVIAIDAGHGGHDVGAIGPKGTYEKNIVLQISKELAAEINRKHGMRAILTRNKDNYVPLRERMQRARQQEADLFISIHADAFRDRRVRGSSVYVLSQHGASSEAARWLAENENAADLVGGVSLGDKDEVVKSVLIDLSQTASIDASIDAADTVLSALKKIGKVHKSTVQHAGFMVLKSPDIPSLLVETAFISNPVEEKRLRTKNYQRKLARALSDGIFRYFSDNPLPDTRFAENYRRQHKVSRGDTLSEIAERYAVSMESIKLANEMSRDRVRTGEILTIP